VRHALAMSEPGAVPLGCPPRDGSTPARSVPGCDSPGTSGWLGCRGQGYLVGCETSEGEHRGMLTLTLRTILPATLIGDDRIVTDHVGWAESLLSTRPSQIGLVAEAFNLRVTALPTGLPRCDSPRTRACWAGDAARRAE